MALKTKALLEQAGAQVLLTRTDSLPMDLYPRTRFAEQHGADVLVSIHANALPDGVNPFTTNGTTVYYFQPRSADLARALDRALVAELGLRDLGMGRGDYALAPYEATQSWTGVDRMSTQAPTLEAHPTVGGVWRGENVSGGEAPQRTSTTSPWVS